MTILILFVFSSSFLSQKFNTPAENTKNGTIGLLIDYLNIKYPSKKFNNFIYVGVKRQQLFLIKEKKIIKSYLISTSKFGAGVIKNSNMTPVGLHKIHNKYGDNVPLGGIFKSKKYTGKIAKIISKPIISGIDIICTRIITIKGLEEGLNLGSNNDSYERNIYIHGTNEEGLIGQPASHGCIRMKNKDIIELFELIEKNSLLVILNN